MSFKTRLLSTPDLNHSAASIPKLSLFNQDNSQRYPYLLQSSAVRDNNTQYDILIACPQYLLTLNSDKTLSCTDENVNLTSGFLDTLEKLYQNNKQMTSDEKATLPFTGGWFVYLSYEMAAEIEPCLLLPMLPESQPLAVAARCPAAIIHDKKNRQLIAIAEEKYEYLLDVLEQDYLKISRQRNESALSDQENHKIDIACLIEDDAQAYLDQVEKIKAVHHRGRYFSGKFVQAVASHLKTAC